MIQKSRYWILIVVLSLVVVSGCTPAPSVAPQQPADKGQVVIYGWSGPWDVWFDTWGKEFTQETGIKVKYLSGDTEVIFTRIQNEASAPQADLFLSDRGDGYRATSLGLVDTIDWSKIPNSGGVNKNFLSPTIGTWSFDMAVIGYNRDVNKTPPTKWTDLADPFYKGKITINTSTNPRPAYIWMLLAQKYGEDQAWDYLLKIFGNAYKWTDSPGEIESGLATGESLAAVATAGMVMQANQELKAPVYSIVPEEGGIFDDNTVMLIKNAPDKDNALQFINFMLGQYYQNEIMNVVGVSMAVNPNVQLTNTNLMSIGYGGKTADYILNQSFAVDWETWMAQEGGATKLVNLITQIDNRVKGLKP